jgi:hypothetical protein
MGICKHITLVILYQGTYSCVTLHKLIFVSIQVPHLVFAVYFKLINFACHIFPLFVPEITKVSKLFESLLNCLLTYFILRKFVCKHTVLFYTPGVRNIPYEINSKLKKKT